eukprot:scaffold15522_cov228-Alexandrium_tamarense.AAC.2
MKYDCSVELLPSSRSGGKRIHKLHFIDARNLTRGLQTDLSETLKVAGESMGGEGGLLRKDDVVHRMVSGGLHTYIQSKDLLLGYSNCNTYRLSADCSQSIVLSLNAQPINRRHCTTY